MGILYELPFIWKPSPRGSCLHSSRYFFSYFRDGPCAFHAPWGRSAFLLICEAVSHDLCSTRWVFMPSTLQGGYAPRGRLVFFMFWKVDLHDSHFPRTDPTRDSPLPSKSRISWDNCLSDSSSLLSRCIVAVRLSSQYSLARWTLTFIVIRGGQPIFIAPTCTWDLVDLSLLSKTKLQNTFEFCLEPVPVYDTGDLLSQRFGTPVATLLVVLA